MNRARRAAFTLVEVILAIIIISGIMVVLLYFYQRTAETRENALREAEFISTARMVLEQLSSELRTARIVQDRFLGLDGTSNSISFVCTALPSTTRWIIGTNESVVLPPATDLKPLWPAGHPGRFARSRARTFRIPSNGRPRRAGARPDRPIGRFNTAARQRLDELFERHQLRCVRGPTAYG